MATKKTPPRAPQPKRAHHFRVPVRPDEKAAIEEQAKAAGMSIASYLRGIGLGYQIRGVTDYKRVRELAQINGDLGRLGGLLKLWLTDDERTAKYGANTILALLDRIETNQADMARVMQRIVREKAKR